MGVGGKINGNGNGNKRLAMGGMQEEMNQDPEGIHNHTPSGRSIFVRGSTG